MLKVRRYDFSTLTRSETLRGPTDDPGVVREAAARLLDSVDTTGGVRLLGVGVSGLADYTQEDLFAQAAGEQVDLLEEEHAEEDGEEQAAPVERRWPAGHDVHHAGFGHGWVQGSGLGRVTVRFETPEDSGPGRVRTFRTDDPELEPTEPLPLVAQRPDGPSADSPPVVARGPGDDPSVAPMPSVAGRPATPPALPVPSEARPSGARAEASVPPEMRPPGVPPGVAVPSEIRRPGHPRAAVTPPETRRSDTPPAEPPQASSEPANLPKSWSEREGGGATSRP